MAYQAIYRKWRPLVFEDVVGQEHITGTLENELITGKVAHAYLFCGTRGTGKTTTAKILSRAVNCQNREKNGNPCNECDSCKGILSGTVMDVIEIDAASNNGVDNIRELRDEILYTPASVKYKVYIIDEVHMLSTGAFNALLKTLEEPPSHAIFILATTEPHKIPATIHSRCQRFDFRRISNRHIAGRIGEIVKKDGIDITPDAIDMVAALGDGSMRDALSILDQCSGIPGKISKSDIENLAGVTGSEAIRTFGDALIRADMACAVENAEKAISRGCDIVNLTEELLEFFRDLLITKISSSASEILDKSEEELKFIADLSGRASEEMLIHAIKTLSDTLSVCKWAARPRVILECAIVKICRPELDCNNDAFAKRIKKLESAVFLASPAADASGVIADAKSKKDTADAGKKKEKSGEDKKTDSAEAKPKRDNNKSWQDIVEAIKNTDAGSAALLIDTEGFARDNFFYIVFKDDTLRDFAKDNKNLTDILEKAVGGLFKFVTHGEFDDKNKEKPDLLMNCCLKGWLGEQRHNIS